MSNIDGKTWWLRWQKVRVRWCSMRHRREWFRMSHNGQTFYHCERCDLRHLVRS